MHDPRLGRFFAVDPLDWKYPYYTPYAFSGNRVIDAIEFEGLEPSEIIIWNNPWNLFPVFKLVLHPGDDHFQEAYEKALELNWKKDVSTAEGGVLTISFRDNMDRNSIFVTESTKWKGFTIPEKRKTWEEMTTWEKLTLATPSQRDRHGWGNEWSGSEDPANVNWSTRWENTDGTMGPGQKIFWSTMLVNAAFVGGVAIVAEGGLTVVTAQVYSRVMSNPITYGAITKVLKQLEKDTYMDGGRGWDKYFSTPEKVEEFFKSNKWNKMKDSVMSKLTDEEKKEFEKVFDKKVK